MPSDVSSSTQFVFVREHSQILVSAELLWGRKRLRRFLQNSDELNQFCPALKQILG